MRRLLLLVSLLACLATWSAAADTLALRLVLRDAATFSGPVTPGSPAVLIDLERTGDRWERGFATSAGFGNTEREVRVAAAAVTAHAITIDLSCIQGTLAEVAGERARYAVALNKTADGLFAGTYTGTVRGQAITGQAEAWVLPARSVKPGVTPVQPGEHPRLLFRKADLPALRAKAQTPFGKVAMTKLPDSPAGLALRHALTGDRALADEARKRVEALMQDRGHGDKRVRSRWFGYRLEQAALAYDLCYDAWDAAFRATVAEYLHDQAQVLFFQRGPGIFDSHLAWGLNTSHSVPVIYGAGFAGLAIWGEKGAEPAKPVAKFSAGGADPVIEPANGYTPGAGVTPADFQSGVMPQNWVYAGAFPEGKDDMAALGGAGVVRPHVGMAVTSGAVTVAFKPLVDKKGYFTDAKLTGGRPMIEINAPPDNAPPGKAPEFTTGYFYSVIRNDKERWVRYDPAHANAPCFLNGVRLSPREVVRLKPGLYPWMVLGPVGSLKPWGKVFMEPRLLELAEDEAKVELAAARATHAEQVEDWQLARDAWARSGGCDPRFLNAYERSRYIMYLCARETPGTGGAAMPGDQMLAIDGLNKYALAHRTAFGTSLSPFEDIEAVLAYKLFVHSYRTDGRLLGLEPNGPAGFTGAGYPDGSPNVAGDMFAVMFPLVRDDLKPTALWAWNRHTGGGLADDAGIAKLFSIGNRAYTLGQPYGTFNSYAIYAFVNYPLNLTPKAPSDSPALPLTWQAPDAGFYGFRNNWSGTDDEFVTHFYSHTERGGAGSLRIVGLGGVWSHGVNASTQARYGENVVQLPEAGINENARGRVTYLTTEPDGSGALTVSLDDVNSAPVEGANDRLEALFERYGGYRRPQGYGDQGITGFRAMAVDYSGKCGAPALIVLVDSITGGGKKLWTWQIESKSESGGATTRANADVKEDILFDGKQFKYKIGQLLKLESKTIANDPMVKVTDTGFVLTQGGATLRATFATPVTPKIELAQRIEWRQGVKSGVSKNSSKAIFAEGGDAFFVVMTLQKGDAPPVTVEGAGLNAKVTVGNRVVSFDGTKVVIADK